MTPTIVLSDISPEYSWFTQLCTFRESCYDRIYFGRHYLCINPTTESSPTVVFQGFRDSTHRKVVYSFHKPPVLCVWKGSLRLGLSEVSELKSGSAFQEPNFVVRSILGNKSETGSPSETKEKGVLTRPFNPYRIRERYGELERGYLCKSHVRLDGDSIMK